MKLKSVGAVLAMIPLVMFAWSSHHRPVSRLQRRVCAWLLVALVLLKLAVPGLASLAAAHQAVDLVEVCSVYGVRLVPAEPVVDTLDAWVAESPGHGSDAAPGIVHASADHCALGALLAGVTPAPQAAVCLHAPAPRPQQPPRVLVGAYPDPVQRWLTGVQHAPPVRA